MIRTPFFDRFLVSELQKCIQETKEANRGEYLNLIGEALNCLNPSLGDSIVLWGTRLASRL